jgi:hypothetical protein
MEWVTKEEAKKLTGMSDSTIERRVKDNVLRRDYRSVPGRKHEPVFSKEDLEKLSKPKQAVVLKGKPRPRTHGRLPAITSSQQVGKPSRQQLATIPSVLSVPLEKKLYLSLPEAVAYSGLPRVFLEEKIERKELRSLFRGKYIISRKDLEELSVF